MARKSVPPRRFTDRYLGALKPRATRYEVSEPSGLILRVSSGGAKTFQYFYRFSGRTRRMSLGRYPAVSLSEARKRLEAARELREKGVDPAEGGAVETVAQLADEFYQRYLVPERKRPEIAKQILDADIVPALGTRKLADVTPRHIVSALDPIVDRGSRALANRALSLTKQLFGFGVHRGLLNANPAADIRHSAVGGKEPPRERALTYLELRTLWLALDSPRRVSPGIRLALKLLIVTGVRSGELRLARWEQIEDATWTIPAENTKGGREHIVALSDLALELIDGFRSLSGSEWVLPSPIHRDRPLSDKVIARAVSSLRPHIEIAPWTAHDLRRTFATRLADLKVEPYIVEKCLGHRLPKLFETYSRSDYLPERREALQLWADRIRRLIDESDNVVELRS